MPNQININDRTKEFKIRRYLFYFYCNFFIILSLLKVKMP